MSNKTRIYAYYLPQYHECPYNNKWWGKGFTEWDNVRKTIPLFKGHNQPRVPLHGYYNLLDDEFIEKQYSLAKKYCIDGFVFYHYWYEGKTPLGSPLEHIKKNASIDLKYSLCWANHSWTKSWKNRKGSLDVLIEQTYEKKSTERIKHYEYLCQSFIDQRYIRIKGKPLFQIYIPEDIPELNKMIDELRSFCLTHYSLDLHISGTLRSWMPSYEYLNNFDSITLAQPTLSFFAVDDLFSQSRQIYQKQYYDSLVRNLPLSFKKLLYIFQDIFLTKPHYFDYDEVWEKVLFQSMNALKSDRKINIGTFVDFDNTPRYKNNAKIIRSFSPDKFEKYITRALKLSKKTESNVLFINAWNEWGEGMYLEEDTKYLDFKLLAVKNAVEKESLL